MLYLNHAGTSWPKPEGVLAAVEEATHAEPSTWADRFEAAHTAIATHLGVGPEALRLTPGCTQALASSLADVPLAPGAQVLVSSLEHHALLRPLWKRRDLQVREVPRALAGPFDLDAYAQDLDRGGVGLVAVSVASNVTGERLPIEAILEQAHARGVPVLLDGAQAAGWIPLDLTAMGVDLFTFAGHKGPQAPYGIGGLYVRPGFEMSSPRAHDGAVHPGGPSYCDHGSVNLPALCGLAAGWQWMAEQRPLEAALDREATFRDGAAALEGVTVFGQGPRMPTCSLLAEGIAPDMLGEALRRRGVYVRTGTHCAPRAHEALGTGPAGTVRFSFGPSDLPTAAEDAVQALSDTLHQVRRST